DRYFAAQAEGSKPVLGLETVEEQLQVLASAPTDLQVKGLREMIDLAELGGSPVSGILDAYGQGEVETYVDALDEDEDVASRAYNRRILHERNYTMAKRLETLFQPGARPFVVVGAGHVVGDEGIPDLLKGRGWTVTKVPPSGERIALELPEENPSKLATTLVTDVNIAWPTPPTERVMKTGGAPLTFLVAPIENGSITLTQSRVPGGLVSSLEQLYSQNSAAIAAQLAGQVTDSRSMKLSGFEANRFIVESATHWSESIQVWGDGRMYTLFSVAKKPVADATQSVLTGVLDSFSLVTVTAEAQAAALDRARETLRSQPDWLYPFEACPLEASRQATEAPKEKKTLPCRGRISECIEACEAGDGWLCMEAADQMETDGVKERDLLAPLYVRSCTLGFVEGCDSLALAQVMNEESAASCYFEILEEGCRKNEPWACAFLGQLARAEKWGDKEKANAYFNAACALLPNHPGCKMAKQARGR
ncbi:MAG: TraB/GumN family protein, partial [Myxococcota bacterium]